VPEAAAPASALSVESPSVTSSLPPPTSEDILAVPDVSPGISPFKWIRQGIADGLRRAPILLVAFGCALFIYSLGALLCIGDFLVFGPLLGGVWAVALGISRRETGTLGRIFDGFSIFWRAVGLGLLWMLMGAGVGLLIWGLFLLCAVLLPAGWLLSGALCMLLGSYPAWRLSFAPALLVDRKLVIGQCLAGSWRMTSGPPMHFAWIVFVLYGLVLGTILGVVFVVVGGLFGVGVTEMVKSSNDPSRVFAAFGSTVFVLGFLALLFLGVWLAAILMALAHGYNHLMCRLHASDNPTQVVGRQRTFPVQEASSGGSFECPGCHQQIEVGSRFCRRCGFPVADHLAQAQRASHGASAGQAEGSVGNAALVPPQDASLASSPPTAMAVAEVQPAYQPAVAVHYSGRVEMGAPTPAGEEILWQGRQSPWFYVPTIVWSALWFTLWIYLASFAGRIVDWVEAHQVRGLHEILQALQPVAATYSWAFYFPATLALWGIARSILRYFNAHFLITTQRVKVRTGILSQTIMQIELFRLKDIALQKSLWGRICQYGHLLLISSDRLMGETSLRGVPQAETQLETIRHAAQQARAQSGIVNISE
jgi:hypothetical protein